jgi:hypothetical protein
VLTQVPVGYIRTDDERIDKTPDRQIQEAIAGIFRNFRELSSVRYVLLWYRQEKLLIPVLSREPGNRKVVWAEPVYPRIFGILKNPTYAGAFAGAERRPALPSSKAVPARPAAMFVRGNSGKW